VAKTDPARRSERQEVRTSEEKIPGTRGRVPRRFTFPHYVGELEGGVCSGESQEDELPPWSPHEVGEKSEGGSVSLHIELSEPLSPAQHHRHGGDEESGDHEARRCDCNQVSVHEGRRIVRNESARVALSSRQIQQVNLKIGERTKPA